MFENEQDTYLGFGHVLLKADAKDKSVIYLEASNDGLDSDEEVVIRKALEDQAASTWSSASGSSAPLAAIAPPAAGPPGNRARGPRARWTVGESEDLAPRRRRCQRLARR